MSAIITINDNNLLIQVGNDVANSQGYALLLEDKVGFDFNDEGSAIKSCRLQPQQIQNRYWQECAQTSIGANKSGVRSSADLIWQHLTAIRTKYNLDEIVFIVPSHYQQDNLQLLLGIAHSSDLAPQALVNKAVVAIQHYAEQDGEHLHIDLQLHQTVCSLVTVKQGLASLSDIDIVADVSIQRIQDALLREMQQSFIQGTRFDPLHYAETEQQLFDQLNVIAKNIALEGKTIISVDYSTQVHSITMDSVQWNSVIEPFVTKLAIQERSKNSVIQLNALFGGIAPPSFNQAGMAIVDDNLFVRTNLVDKGNDDEEDLVYQIELPLLSARQVKPKEAGSDFNKDVSTKPAVKASFSNKSVASNQQVTHLMQAGLAIPLNYAKINIDSGQLNLTRAAESNLEMMLEQKQLFIISDLQRSALQLNDRIGSNYADGVINAIQVLE